MRVQIKPELLRWARQRAGFSPDDLAGRFLQIEAWEKGSAFPTLRQIERFAKAAYTPVGFLFLPEPPVEQIPIPDFRTVNNEFAERPSPNLLDTIYVCQQRQEWRRNFMRSMGEEPLPFVGSVRLINGIEATAANIRHALGFDLEERRQIPTWTEALRRFIQQAEGMRILVMCSGMVLNNNRRKLDPDEFHGFAIADDLAPLIFINGADTRAAQMFTLAHIWVGESALTDVQASWVSRHKVERWCNQVAAELLAPMSIFNDDYRKSADLDTEVARLAKCFKVSTLVILRRIHDAGGLTREQFWQEYRKELGKLISLAKGSGGNFYLAQVARLSKRFARALVASTHEGQTLYRNAFRLLGFSKLAQQKMI